MKGIVGIAVAATVAVTGMVALVVDYRKKKAERAKTAEEVKAITESMKRNLAKAEETLERIRSKNNKFDSYLDQVQNNPEFAEKILDGIWNKMEEKKPALIITNEDLSKKRTIN